MQRSGKGKPKRHTARRRGVRAAPEPVRVLGPRRRAHEPVLPEVEGVVAVEAELVAEKAKLAHGQCDRRARAAGSENTCVRQRRVLRLGDLAGKQELAEEGVNRNLQCGNLGERGTARVSGINRFMTTSSA